MFWGFFKPQKASKMNYAKPVGSPQTTVDRPVRILIIGEVQSIRSTIDQLCSLGFCERLNWSTIMPKPDSQDWMSIMTK